MKNLKFDHKLALLIRQGKVSSTWRTYDDKDLRVNDSIELIDKVDPNNPSLWTSIGQAKITKVVEKRLEDANAQDFPGQEDLDTPEEILETFQKYYGPKVDLGTPVKIVHFSLMSPETIEPPKTSRIKEVKIYADGGSRGNPGPSACGFAIMSMNDDIIVKGGTYLGITTNNQAEYHSLKQGLEMALENGARVVHVYMDSMLVINQMLGIYKVKNRDLWPIHTSIRQVVSKFEKVTFTHVPRALNKIADGQVNKILDEQLGSAKQ